MNIIDFHTHAFPDELAAKAISALTDDTYRPHGDGTAGGLVSNMHLNGISRSVLASIATKPEQASKITRWSVSVRERFPEIIPFGSVHPDSDFKSELESIGKAGLKGVKLHPFYQNFAMDDEKMFPAYELMREMGLVLLFHAGYDDAYKPDDRAGPSRLKKVIRRFPGLKVVAAHLGAYKQWDEVIGELMAEDLWIDTCYIIGYITESQKETIFTRFPRNRILLGSDYPWSDQRRDVELIRGMGLPETDKELILHKNAEALLGLSC